MIPISGTWKAVIGTILAGLIPAGTYLLKLEPSWTWLSVGLGALVYIDGLLTSPPGKSA